MQTGCATLGATKRGHFPSGMCATLYGYRRHSDTDTHPVTSLRLAAQDQALLSAEGPRAAAVAVPRNDDRATLGGEDAGRQADLVRDCETRASDRLGAHRDFHEGAIPRHFGAEIHVREMG